MLDIADTVYVSVDVNIAILGIERRSRLRRSYLYARRLFNGARLVAHIIHDAASMQSQQVGGFAGIEADHRPYGTGISYLLSVLVDNGKITVGEETVDILHPCPDGKSSYWYGISSSSTASRESTHV